MAHLRCFTATRVPYKQLHWVSLSEQVSLNWALNDHIELVTFKIIFINI